MTCTSCGKEIDNDSKFCPFCGEAIAPKPPAPRFCPECGKQFDHDGKFCRFCGAALNAPSAAPAQPVAAAPSPEPEPPAPTPAPTPAPAPAQPLVGSVQQLGGAPGYGRYSIGTRDYSGGTSYADYAANGGNAPGAAPAYNAGEAPAKKSGCGTGLIILVCVVICGFIFLSVFRGCSHMQENDLPIVADVSTILTPEVLKSEYDKKLPELMSSVEYFAADSIKDELANPNSAIFAYHKEKFTAEGALATAYGDVTYTNKNNQKVTEPFEFAGVLNADMDTGFRLYLKIGDDVILDKRDGVDPHTGIITAGNISFAGRSYGEKIIEDLCNTDDWSHEPSSLTEKKVTPEQYEAIQTGMTYDEVCALIGEKGKRENTGGTTNTEYFIVHWSGAAGPQSLVSVMFQDSKVLRKSQIGLQ